VISLSRDAYLREYSDSHAAERSAYGRARRALKLGREIIGIDGEGLTVERPRPSDDFEGPMPGDHRYLYMAAWGIERKVGDLDLDPMFAAGHFAPERTRACLDFLLSLPQDALILGFSLGYDYTKILEGLDDKTLFEIARPELRQGKHGPRSRRWGDWESDGKRGTYKLNYIKGKFSCAKVIYGEHAFKCAHGGTSVHAGTGKECRGCKVFRSCTVWDIYAFFQSSFIKACKLWKVVTEQEYDELATMKARRSTFRRNEWEKIKDYCGQECRKMALLAKRLLEAHEEAGLKLTSYYGAGSTAARMLKEKFDAKLFIGKPLPAMIEAISCGFFGGRFEMSRVGPVRQHVYSYDIASAYPYQFTFLPCLACGHWELHRGEELQRRIEESETALIHYDLPICDSLKVDPNTDSSPAVWGPFPLRAYGLNNHLPEGDGETPGLSELPSNGSILYPVSSGGGWVYREEFLTAQKFFPNVVATEAWIYTKNCGHQPFNDVGGERSTMPEQYLLRIAWGKEGRGIVVKLGTNSCYGKAAQSVGNAPPFQCYLWAGIVTSGCRAQLLGLMMGARDPAAILGTATDGILSTEKLILPEPRETGTREKSVAAGKHPLGAWEAKDLEKGIMLIRPGIAFPLDAEIEAEVKARGIGKSVLASHRAGVLAQWEKKPWHTYHLSRTLFFGMKSATDPPSHHKTFPSRRANYGQWGEQPQKVSYSPFPKRPRQQGRATLRTWAFGSEVKSAPYERLLDDETRLRLRRERRGAVNGSHEEDAAKRFETLMSEQPDREDAARDMRDEG
jgi:hypothetical protein